MRLVLIFILFIGVVIPKSNAQCIEIESILVDACGSPEGPNEMVRFKVGSSNILVNDINANWPNNSFLGICQNATTSNNVATMNATIQSCGYFIEPVGGILPANSNVLLITSVDFDASAHNYAGLSDTLHVIFQCPGNTAGHFANWTTSGCPNSGDRTLTLSAGPGCSQSVTYDKCVLVNQNGNIGGSSAIRDGARVDFDTAGNPTYENDGCTIPYVPMNISTSFLNGDGTLCDGDIAEVEAQITGNVSSFEWQSNSGSFDDFNSLITNYTPQQNSGTHHIYFSAINGCGDEILDSLLISEGITPDVNIIENILSNDCSQGSIELIAEGADTFIWNSGSSSDTIYPNQSGMYIVMGQNNCGSDTDSIEVSLGNAPSCEIDTSDIVTLCPGDNIVLTASTNANNFNWSTDENTQSITVDEAGTYTFFAENDCGTCSTSVEVIYSDLNADMNVNPTNGNAPLNSSIEYTGQNEDYLYWAIENDTSSENIFNYEFLEAGNYSIHLYVFDTINNCMDSSKVNISVFNEAQIVIPNVFTPNGDQINDTFYPTMAFAELKNAQIFNRWGKIVFEFKGTEAWNGLHFNGQKLTDGVYNYMMEFESSSGKTITKQGVVHLVK